MQTSSTRLAIVPGQGVKAKVRNVRKDLLNKAIYTAYVAPSNVHDQKRDQKPDGLTDRRTDGQTEGHTDARTNRDHF